MDDTILEINDLKVSFINNNKQIQVVRGFDLSMERRDIVGIVGESGSGKTVSASSILRLIDEETGTIDTGSIIYEGEDLIKYSEKQMNNIRGKSISYVFQNPSTALNPYKRIGKQLKSILNVHRLPSFKEDIIKVLEDVGIKNADQVYDMYPYQLSGGINQRVMIGQCVLCKPKLLIADEPTSAIDASIQKKILALLKDINTKYETSIILITHDFDVARYICDRIVIMYGGLVVEEGLVDDVFNHPLHPYTSELIACAKALDGATSKLYTLDGSPPTVLEFSDQCPFYIRCQYKTAACLEGIPETIITNSRKVRCIRYNEKGLI